MARQPFSLRQDGEVDLFFSSSALKSSLLKRAGSRLLSENAVDKCLLSVGQKRSQCPSARYLDESSFFPLASIPGGAKTNFGSK